MAKSGRKTDKIDVRAGSGGAVRRDHAVRLGHAFAQTASDSAEVPVEVLARLMGHKDTRTTAFYFKVRDRRAFRAAKTLRLTGTAATA
jgi:integrase